MDDQTSTEEVIEDSESSTPETIQEETVAVQEPAEDYRKKFSESSKEALRLLEDNKVLEQSFKAERAAKEKIEKEQKELYEALLADDPTKAKALDYDKKIAAIEAEVRQDKEERLLQDFTKGDTLKEKSKEAIRNLARAEGKSFQEVWETRFEPIFKEAQSTKTAKLADKVSKTVEKGTQTPEPSGGIPDGFDKLSLSERREYFRKQGISGSTL